MEEKYFKLKKTFESKGLKVNVNKTKAMKIGAKLLYATKFKTFFI